MVGADGLRSAVRTILFGEQEARFTGVAAWRGTIPMERMPAGFEHAIVTWPGRGRHAMTYPIRPDLQTFNGFVPTTEILREEWGPSGDLDDLRSSFEGATGDVLEIIDRITSALITPIFFRDPLPVWGTDRIILMGDAAHPTPPSAGQGAAQALEDSVTLAACLRRAGGPAGVPAALAEFAARRQARTASMLISARTNLAMFNEPDPDPAARPRRPPARACCGWTRWASRCSAGSTVTTRSPRPSSRCRPPARARRPWRRPEAAARVRAWSGALAFEDRARLWVGEREGYERFTERDVPARRRRRRREPLSCDGVPALRVAAAGGVADEGTVVLHLHGGGYTMGSARGAVDLASRLAEAVGGWALVPDYRLAPEHAFPAGAATTSSPPTSGSLREHAPARVVVSGEDAGGGLAVALAVRLRDAGEPLPAALHVVSPFCDLTVTSATRDRDAVRPTRG